MVEASKGRVLYVGQSYYNTWYLSRELRKMGWRADTLNTDHDDRNRMYYHGEDYNFRYKYKILGYLKKLWFLLWASGRYDIFHFSGAWNMRFVSNLKSKARFRPGMGR